VSIVAEKTGFWMIDFQKAWFEALVWILSKIKQVSLVVFERIVSILIVF
jgi:hypothetical protein